MIQDKFENGTFLAAWGELAESDVQFIVPAKFYNVRHDERLLIPFIKNHKIGFVNKAAEQVVSPKYDAILDNCYSEEDYVRVGINYSYAYERNNNVPQVYNRIKWGLINSKGETVLEPNYGGIIIGPNTFIVRKAYGYGYNYTRALLNGQGEIIVPFGKYYDIEPFENGLSRVRIFRDIDGQRMELCGVINEMGEVILDCTERRIMPFYGKYRDIYFSSVKQIICNENPVAAKAMNLLRI